MIILKVLLERREEYYFRSVHYLMQGLELFSKSTSLVPNPLKTSVYCSGMEARDIKRIVEMTGFQEGKVPFTYLGVPIIPKKLKAADGKVLIEKMVSKI